LPTYFLGSTSLRKLRTLDKEIFSNQKFSISAVWSGHLVAPNDEAVAAPFKPKDLMLKSSDVFNAPSISEKYQFAEVDYLILLGVGFDSGQLEFVGTRLTVRKKFSHQTFS